MADGNSILELLLQGRQPDPAGALYAQAFLEGKVPGSPVEGLHTMLSMLSPGAIAERRAAEPGIGELLGLEEEEEDAVTRQAVGLALSPMQEATLGLQEQQVLAQMLQAMSEQSFKEREVSVKEKEAETKAQTAEQKGEYYGAQMGHLAALTQSMEELAATRYQNRMIRQAALTGVDAEGNPLDPLEKQAFAAAAGLNRTDPQVLTLARALLHSGDANERKFGAQLLSEQLGVDTSAIAEPAGWWQNWSRKISGFLGPEPSMEDLGMQGQVSTEDPELKSLEERANQVRTMLQELLREEQE